MTNEIQRKLTSLTLMTIMFAGGLTFAAPSVMPSAYADHTPYLYVSAENSQFDNTFAGPQVVEVIVENPNLIDTDRSESEPDVTINGKQLRMVQSTDGAWYGYFASRTHAETADSIVTVNGYGLDFGEICLNTNTLNLLEGTSDFSETTGVATNSCSNPSADNNINVVRESKTPTPLLNTVSLGQIGVNDINHWPFIQLYDLSIGSDVRVQYRGAGTVQEVGLKFDTVEGFAGLSTDRDTYPFEAEVHLTVTDVILNIDPTDEDSWTFNTDENGGDVFYQRFDENGVILTSVTNDSISAHRSDLMFDTNGQLLITRDQQGTGDVLKFNNNADNNNNTGNLNGTFSSVDNSYITLVETTPTSAKFVSYDENDDSSINTNNADVAKRGTAATIDYNESPKSIRVGSDFATISIDVDTAIWSSGQEVPVTLKDQDENKNSRSDEDLIVSSNTASTIPTLQIGNPFTLGSGGNSITVNGENTIVQSFSQRAWINSVAAAANTPVTIVVTMSPADVLDLIPPTPSNLADYSTYTGFRGFNLVNVGASSIFGSNPITITLGGVQIASVDNSQSLTLVTITDVERALIAASSNTTTTIVLSGNHDPLTSGTAYPIVFDLFSFGITDDGVQASERSANQIIRIEVEETDDNTAIFKGSLEYTMINQLNVLEASTYSGLSTIADDPGFIVFEDYTDEDSPRVNYNDLGADGVVTPIGVQQEAPSHSGVVSFDSETYKQADTVTITLKDRDLNVDSDLIEIYTIVNVADDAATETVGKAGLPSFDGNALGRLLDVTFDDQIWGADVDGKTCDDTVTVFNTGLYDTGFTLAETASDSGVFKGNFQVPDQYCKRTDSTATYASVTGTDIEVNYVDYRDASGEIIEVGDGAGIRANTGTISLDRTVYPVPFGDTTNFASRTNTVSPPSIFAVHSTAISGTVDTTLGETLPANHLQVHIRVNDPDYDISAAGSDRIATNTATAFEEPHGPVKITVSRGGDSVILGYAGGENAVDGLIGTDLSAVPRLGPIAEISPDSGVFELDLEIHYSDGPQSSQCPVSGTYNSLMGSQRFQDESTESDKTYCILQGDIITVEYSDPTDASGQLNTVTDSATFDLRNGVLQTDKSVYVIGGDMLLILIEPDLNLDSDAAETIDLDLIEWDSDASTLTMGNLGEQAAAFDPEPSDLRETGDNTGIFQVVIEIPRKLGSDELERGEKIDLEYTDYGPSGADYVGDEDEDINAVVFTSNFGATIELDQRVYTWTDKVYITITAPDHNFDSNLIDEIGDGVDADPLRISTRSASLTNYKLVETGTNTGIFSGEVILTGFQYDADGDSTTGTNGYDTNPLTGGVGPTSGVLPTSDDDGITVSYEYTEDNTVIGTALIRWNVAEVTWLETSYSAAGSGLVRVIDPDLNLNPESIDNFNIDIWSDTDAGGVDVTVTETNEATGIFEGTVFFTLTDESSGHRVRISEGDTVTARYSDNTLPDPYSSGDDLDVYATTLIGTLTPPLERVGVNNLGTVDALGNSLSSVSVNQQVQIQASLTNNQDRSQSFAYLVQIQDANGVTVALSWLNGELSASQSLNTAQSWIPASSGTYTAQVFVWEGVSNPTALAPSTEISITVS